MSNVNLVACAINSDFKNFSIEELNALHTKLSAELQQIEQVHASLLDSMRSYMNCSDQPNKTDEERVEWIEGQFTYYRELKPSKVMMASRSFEIIYMVCLMRGVDLNVNNESTKSVTSQFPDEVICNASQFGLSCDYARLGFLNLYYSELLRAVTVIDERIEELRPTT